MSDSEDKKRNKLGYQRISIACAHCRRRKIRCLLAENDPQERCQNCIRLKKECVFYPVDQQQALDNRSQSAARSGTASVQSSGVSPSPPELASGRPFERTRQFGSYPSLPSLPSNAPPGFGMPIGSGAPVPGQGEYISGFPPHGVHGPEGMGPPVEYGFQQAPVDSQRAWEQSASMSSPNAPLNRARDSMQPQYWRSSPTGTVPSADFAPFPSNSNASVMSDGSFAYPVPNSQGWHSSQNARSVSYGQLPDGASHGYIPPSAGYPPQPAQEVQPIHPATAASSQTSTHTAPPIHNSAPGGTPIMPLGQPSPFMFQSQGSVSASPIPGQLPYAGHWYADHSPYGVDEQDLRSPTDQRPFTSKPAR